MRPENLERYQFSSIECISDMSQGYENMYGENCRIKNPEIEIRFKQSNLASISEIKVQRNHIKNPGNVRQIEVFVIDANNTLLLNDIDDSVMSLKSPLFEPIIKTDLKNVRGLKLRILGTDNDQSVRGLRIMIQGCYATCEYLIR